MIEFILEGRCKAYREVPTGARITSVNDIEAIGKCEGCGRVILEGHTYYWWGDDVITCKRCGPPPKEGDKPL